MKPDALHRTGSSSDSLLYLLGISLPLLCACSPQNQQWGRLVCSPTLQNESRAEVTTIEIAFRDDSLSIKEVIQYRHVAPAKEEENQSGKKLKIYDICKYIDVRNWKCGSFQMQEGELVKNETIRFSNRKEDYSLETQSKICFGKRIPNSTPDTKQTSLAKVTPTVVETVARNQIDKATVETKPVAAALETTTLNSKPVEAPQPPDKPIDPDADKAVRAFLSQLIVGIRANISFTQTSEEKLESVAEISLTSEGKIASFRITQTSGNAAWDASVLKAIASTQPSPPKTAFKMPQKVILAFSNRE